MPQACAFTTLRSDISYIMEKSGVLRHDLPIWRRVVKKKKTPHTSGNNPTCPWEDTRGRRFTNTPASQILISKSFRFLLAASQMIPDSTFVTVRSTSSLIKRNNRGIERLIDSLHEQIVGLLPLKIEAEILRPQIPPLSENICTLKRVRDALQAEAR